MSSLPIPLITLLRKLLVAFSKTTSLLPSPPLSSLLKSISIPSLGYIVGWYPRSKSAVLQSSSSPSDPKRPNERKPSDNESGSVQEKPPDRRKYDLDTPIYQLMNNPALFDPLRTPRNPLVLAHGLYGFDVRGISAFPKVQIDYWRDVRQILRNKIGAEVIVTGAPSTGSIGERAETMHETLKKEAAGRQLNFIAHSMGGLDCRHLISTIKPTEYTPLSLTTVCTPHRGSPFMDWLVEKIGIGSIKEQLEGIKQPIPPALQLPDSIISILDSPAYSNLTTAYLQGYFNPNTPDSPYVKYWSVAARTSKMSFFHPLWLPKLILDSYEEKLQQKQLDDAKIQRPLVNKPSLEFGNDGLVTVESARWGEFLGILEESDHWDVRGSVGLSDLEWDWPDWKDFLGAWSQGRRMSDDPAEIISAVQKMPNLNKDKKTLDPPPLKEEPKPSEKGASFTAGLDWVVENVPGIATVKVPFKLVTVSRLFEKGSPKEAKEVKPVPPKFDLERFYVALSRKLYDEGL